MNNFYILLLFIFILFSAEKNAFQLFVECQKINVNKNFFFRNTC